MMPSQLVRILVALCSIGATASGMAQTPGPLPTAESRSPASAPPVGTAPGAKPPAGQAAAAPAPAAAPASTAEPRKDVEPVDPNAEAERRKAEEALRKKREEARLKSERDSRCVIRPVMTDAEIARCR